MLNRLLSLFQKARKFLLETQNINLVRASSLFDETWYLSNKPDIAQAKVNPLLHYLRYGGFEGRDPSPKFCSAFYINTYADMKSAKINPLVHYLMYGKAEGRYTPPKYKCPVCSMRINGFLPNQADAHSCAISKVSVILEKQKCVPLSSSLVILVQALRF